MPIDIRVEKLIAPRDAAAIFPKPPSDQTLWRWINRGVRGVRLETVVAGGKRYTSMEATQRFLDHCTMQADGKEHSA